MLLCNTTSFTSNNTEKNNMRYSKKSITLPPKEQYKIYLISKLAEFMKRTRWKAWKLLQKIKQSDRKTFGFWSRQYPLTEFANFEPNLVLMIKNIKFRCTIESFSRTIMKEYQKITPRQQNIHFSQQIYKDLQNAKRNIWETIIWKYSKNI